MAEAGTNVTVAKEKTVPKEDPINFAEIEKMIGQPGLSTALGITLARATKELVAHPSQSDQDSLIQVIDAFCQADFPDWNIPLSFTALMQELSKSNIDVIKAATQRLAQKLIYIMQYNVDVAKKNPLARASISNYAVNGKKFEAYSGGNENVRKANEALIPHLAPYKQ